MNYIILNPKNEFGFVEFYNSLNRVDYTLERIAREENVLIVTDRKQAEKIVEESKKVTLEPNVYFFIGAPQLFSKTDIFRHFTHLMDEPYSKKEWSVFKHYMSLCAL